VAKLTYLMLASLDGYVADEPGRFDWAEPDEDVHTLVNELGRPIGTHLYGRRMYEVLVAWETPPLDDQPSHIREFAETWRSAEKIVYSSTLDTVSSARTRIEPSFDPGAVREMKAAADRDLSIGGPSLAAEALRPRRRDLPRPHPRHRGRRHSRAPRRPSPRPRAGGRTRLRQRLRVPAPRRQALTQPLFAHRPRSRHTHVASRLQLDVQGPTPPIRSGVIRVTKPGGGSGMFGNTTSGPRYLCARCCSISAAPP
jgi:dihydrofolate reductase